jgi:hypothetical protein
MMRKGVSICHDECLGVGGFGRGWVAHWSESTRTKVKGSRFMVVVSSSDDLCLGGVDCGGG